MNTERESANPYQPTDTPGVDGRPARGEGWENQQDYVNERLVNSGNTDEFGKAADELEQLSEDIERLDRKNKARTGQD